MFTKAAQIWNSFWNFFFACFSFIFYPKVKSKFAKNVFFFIQLVLILFGTFAGVLLFGLLFP